MQIPYTITNIDSAGTVVFTFNINGTDFSCGENFDNLQDSSSTDDQGNVTTITAAQQLDQLIQNYIQQYLPPTIAQSIQALVGNEQIISVTQDSDTGAVTTENLGLQTVVVNPSNNGGEPMPAEPSIK